MVLPEESFGSCLGIRRYSRVSLVSSVGEGHLPDMIPYEITVIPGKNITITDDS